MDQLELIDAAKAITGSDYATAKAIGVSRQTISQGRNGLHRLDLRTIGALAELCGMQPLRTIAAVAAGREGQSKKGRDWRRWAGAAAVCLGVWVSAFISFPSVTYAASPSASDIHYEQYQMQLVPRTVKSILQQLRGFLCGVLPRFFEMFGCVRVL